VSIPGGPVRTNDSVLSDRIESISSNSNTRLWFLKKLKRAGVSQKNLVFYYEAVVRPVLEYASPVWHTSLTADQTKTLEAVQGRACQIITGGGTCLQKTVHYYG